MDRNQKSVIKNFAKNNNYLSELKYNIQDDFFKYCLNEGLIIDCGLDGYVMTDELKQLLDEKYKMNFTDYNDFDDYVRCYDL